jgi:hypothetical protein
VVIGAMTARFYHGRRFLLIFCVILGSIISELFLYFLRLFFENNDLGDALDKKEYIIDQSLPCQIFCLTSNIFVYLEYNLVCIFGLIDLAKIE